MRHAVAAAITITSAITSASACSAEPVPIEGGTSPCDPEPDLDRVRAATEAYADEALALAAGYVPQDACDADALTGAAMGVHYVRVADSLDQTLDVQAPDVLLYLPEEGGVRLAGVEYVRPALVDGAPTFDADPDPDAFDPAPELLCRPLDGPMQGHVPGQPWHYDLHVWLYVDNPDGLFAPYNPAEGCDG